MRTGQRERRGRVIECGRLPTGRTMTLRTGMTELVGDMVGVGRAVEVGLMTGKTLTGRAGVLTVHMTLRTRDTHMRARQLEPGQAVIKARRLPARGCMALRATMTEVRRHMIGVGRAVEVGLMTGKTLTGRAPVIRSVDMAPDT